MKSTHKAEPVTKHRRPPKRSSPESPYFLCTYTTGDTAQHGFLSSPDFTNLMNRLISAPLLEGNHIEGLMNGDAFFPAILEEIRNAKKTICIETYVWSSGEISDLFIEALTERAANGISVQVICDGFGGFKFKRRDINRLKDGGVRFVFYKRARWYQIKPNLARRTHRKIVVIDGRVGFAGGFGIDDHWKGKGDSKDCWRDNAYRLRGPVVSQMQAVFSGNWVETTSEVLAGNGYFPDLAPEGNTRAQFYRGVPIDRYGSIRLAFLIAITAAEHRIRIANAYFIPDDEARDLLLAVRKRGVRVEIIVPRISDTTLGRAASRSRWKPLLEAGVELYRFQPAMLHCKYLVVDDTWSVAGSANFDSRSFGSNDESNFNAYDGEFAARHIRMFQEDRERSEPYTLADHRNRPARIKLADFAAGFVRKLL